MWGGGSCLSPNSRNSREMFCDCPYCSRFPRLLAPLYCFQMWLTAIFPVSATLLTSLAPDYNTVESSYIIHGIYHPAAYIGHFRPEPNFYIIKPRDISSSSPVISATLRGARGNMCALRVALIALIAGVAAWETLSLAATATPVCKHKWLCFIRARWLQRNGQVWHGKKKLWSWTSSSSWNMARVSAVQQSNLTSSDLVVFTIQLAFRGWIGPTGLSSSRLYQPLWSGPGVDDTTGFYCIAVQRRVKQSSFLHLTRAEHPNLSRKPEIPEIPDRPKPNWLQAYPIPYLFSCSFSFIICTFPNHSFLFSLHYSLSTYLRN